MNEAKVGIVNTHLVAIPGFSKGLLGVSGKKTKKHASFLWFNSFSPTLHWRTRSLLHHFQPPIFHALC